MILSIPADSLRPIQPLFRHLKNGALPILGHIRISLETGQTEATIEGTDLDIHILTRVPVQAPSTPGTFTVPAREFFNLVRTADKNSTIAITASPSAESSEYKVEIHHLSKKLASSLTLIGLEVFSLVNNPEADDPEADDALKIIPNFPPVPTCKGPRSILPSATISAITTLAAAASTDETRYVLNGVLADPEAGGTIVATDGRRLAICQSPYTGEKTIFPTKLINILKLPILRSAAVLTINDTGEEENWNRNVMLTFGKTTVHSKTIVGNYPNYKQVIPPERKFSATLAAATAESLIPWLREVAKRARKSNCVSVEFRSSSATLTAKEPDHSATSITVPIYSPDCPAEGLKCGYNPSFFADGLALGLNTIDLIDESSPALLTNGATRYVLMPMRVLDPEPEPATETEPAHA